MTEQVLPAREPAAPAVVEAGPHVTVIEPRNGWVGVDWAEIWKYRELLYFLIWREVKVRYKQTVLGAAWAILQPLLTMVVFTIFFGRLAGLDKQTGGVPYPLFVYAGLMPWTFFANSLSNCGASVVGNSSLITKVYFPRLFIPLSAVGAQLVDLAISSVVLLAMLLFGPTGLGWELLLAPLFLAGTALIATGIGSWLSALMVAYRDFRYVVPFMVQIWMFVSAVMYPASLVPERWRWLLALNPMAGLIEGFRSACFARPFDWPNVGISLAAAVVLSLWGVLYFRRVERRFADII